jgi:2'-5' RNA ligase
LTERPRLYGFHATLKAPFRLAPGQDEDALFAALERFCKARPAFPLGPLGIEAIASGAGAGFVAMIQVRPSPALALLEHDTVRAFDGFRAPPTEDELRRRRPESLSERQREALARFGYPHVGPDYRFHMTLSGETVDVAPLADSLAEAMANRVGSAHLDVDALVLFRQPQAGAPFRVLRRFALEGLSTD